jgi:hypothetical protein
MLLQSDHKEALRQTSIETDTVMTREQIHPLAPETGSLCFLCGI